MFTVVPIESLDLPQLEPYRTMRRQAEHRAQGIFVAEGEKVVRRLLESRFTVISALMPEKWLSDLEPLLRARPETVAVYIAEKKLLETLTGFSMYQGLLALGKIPPVPSLETLLERSKRPWLFAAADGLTSAENLGAIVRNCAAFTVDGLIVGETCVSPFLRRAVRSSMGTIFQLPVIEIAGGVESSRLATQGRGSVAVAPELDHATMKAALESLRERGVCCVAADAHAKTDLAHSNLVGDTCIVFGSEGYGISRELLDLCEEKVVIPMSESVDSLNVASAVSVFLYEANRQRAKERDDRSE